MMRPVTRVGTLLCFLRAGLSRSRPYGLNVPFFRCDVVAPRRELVSKGRVLGSDDDDRMGWDDRVRQEGRQVSVASGFDTLATRLGSASTRKSPRCGGPITQPTSFQSYSHRSNR